MRCWKPNVTFNKLVVNIFTGPFVLAILLCVLPINVSGQSQVEVLYRNETSYRPYRIAQDTENLYWMDGNQLLAVSKKTRKVRVVGMASALESVLIESGGYVYKIARSSITRFRSSGGTEEVVYERPNSFADMMAVSPTGLVVWLTNQDDGGLVQAMSISERKIITLAAGEKTSNFGRVIADESNVYWIEPQTGILKAVSAKGGQVRIISSNCNPGHLAQDENYIFFQGSPGIMRASKKSFKVEFVAKLPPYISALAVSESHIYYAGWSQRSMTTGYISKVPKSGGISQYVAKDLKTPNSLLVDSQYVYFADDENNMVARIPR